MCQIGVGATLRARLSQRPLYVSATLPLSIHGTHYSPQSPPVTTLYNSPHTPREFNLTTQKGRWHQLSWSLLCCLSVSPPFCVSSSCHALTKGCIAVSHKDHWSNIAEGYSSTNNINLFKNFICFFFFVELQCSLNFSDSIVLLRRELSVYVSIFYLWIAS